MKKVVLFCRVSSTNDRQNYERQVNDLTQLSESSNYKIEAVFAEKISGGRKNSERKELLNMIQYVNENNIDKVLVTELSRLGRDPLQIWFFVTFGDGLSGLRQNHFLPQQLKTGPPVHLPFNTFDPIDMSFHRTIAPGHPDPILYSFNISQQTPGKGF